MTRPAFRLAAMLAASPAFAHEAQSGIAWGAPDLLAATLVAAAGILYSVGVARLWLRAGRGRGIRPWQLVCIAAGLVLLATQLMAQVRILGDTLFVAHMIEHEILIAASAPLIVLSRPAPAFAWSLPQSIAGASGSIIRKASLDALWSWLTRPMVATIVHGVTIWMWHIPALFEAALGNEWLHWLQHLSFFATALLFWQAVIRRPARGSQQGLQFFCLFVTSLHTSLLGVLLVFARGTVYPAQTSVSGGWGLTPLQDQQLAGLVMWIPGGMVYASAALAVAGLWISGPYRSNRDEPAR